MWSSVPVQSMKMERKRVQESKNRHLYPATAQVKETVLRASRGGNVVREWERRRGAQTGAAAGVQTKTGNAAMG